MSQIIRACSILLASVVFAGAAAAAPIDAGFVYQILDHPDGALGPPGYALRLDGLDGDASNDFTFSAETNGAELTLVYDDTAMTLTIEGTVYGGQVENNMYIDPQLWDVSFQYGVVNDLGDALEAVPGTGVGTITALGAGGMGVGAFDLNEIFNLVDKSNMSGLAFRLDEGHRVPDDTITGHGWLTHDGGKRTSSQDWLFTVRREPLRPVPEPSTLVLLGGGLMMLATSTRHFSRR
ncbi:MAG: PEP-CTERM sorting domain-containing protein [Myxococcota bacterium]